MRHLAESLVRNLMVLACSAFLVRPADAAETLRINGSGSALDLLKPIIAAYEKTKPGLVIEMGKPLGSSGALKALLAGALDIAASSKPVAPEDVAQGARFQEYGRTPLTIVTGENTRKKDITTEELANIYAGKVLAWSTGEPIRIILRPQTDIDTKILQGLSPSMDHAVQIAQKQPGMIVAVTDPESNELVAKTPGSIGAAALCGVLGVGYPLNVLTLNGVKPTLKNLATGIYPMAKEIRFATTAKSAPSAAGFLAFVYSSKGRAIAEKMGVLVTAENPLKK